MAGVMSKAKTITCRWPSQEVNLVWEIDDFKPLCGMRKFARDMTAFSLEFETGEKIDMVSKWRIYLHTGKSLEDEVELTFELIDNGGKADKPFHAYATISTDKALPDPEGGDGDQENLDPLQATLWLHDFNGDKRVECSFSKSVSASDLFEFRHHGILTLHVDFRLHGSVTKSVQDNRVLIDSALGECSNAYKSMMLDKLKNGKSADVVFKTMDDKKIKAHKNILSFQSDVFNTMFDSDMKEKKDGIVELSDIGSDGLNIFLKYLYTGDVDETWSDYYEEIINAADKYQVHPLKDACDKMLITICTKDNCCELLEIANLHNLPIAKRKIEEFVSSDPELLLKLSGIFFQKMSN